MSTRISEFHTVFQISRMVVFSVSYYTLGGNKAPYFSTTAARFNQPKTDYSECGQCQDRLLTGAARRFWEKWDSHHLGQLTDEELAELRADMDALKERYEWIEKFSPTKVGNGFTFQTVRELSMRKVKRVKKAKK